MAKYLVIANQTALSEELTQGLIKRAEEDPDAEFVLVVPATPVESLVTMEEGQARQIAARRAGRALTQLTDAGIPIVGALVGAPSPFEAIQEAVHSAQYAGIIFCTFPPGASRWLEPGLFERVEKAVNLPVTHLVAIHGHIMGSGRSPRPSYLSTN